MGVGDTFSYFSNCYKYYDVDPTESGTIDLDALSTCQCGPEQGYVNLTFSNNVTGSANTTTALGGFTSVNGNVGDPYTFTNSIVANAGYQFTSGPTWNPSTVITGTISSGTTNITQTVTGNVQAISLTSFTTNASPEVSSESACAAGKGATRYHTGSGTYPTDGDTLYQTNNFGAPMGAGYWGLVNGTYVVTNSSSVVIESGLCI